MKKVIFKGAGVAIVTPFTQDYKIDYAKLGELIDAQIAGGTDAIVICGTTGESATMTLEEHKKCVEFAVSHTAGRVPVVAGTGSNDTAAAVELTKDAKRVGADAALCVTPYYNKASQEGLYRHFTAIADSCDIPVILYNVPGRTGTNIKPETYARLSAHPNVNSVKEANGDIAALIRTRALCGDELNIYSGEDGMITPILSIGGIGVISVLSNVCPRQTHEICSLWFEGKSEQSAALQIKYSELVAALFCDVNPIPVKTALELMGVCSGRLRLPLCEMSESGKKQLVSAMKNVGLL